MEIHLRQVSLVSFHNIQQISLSPNKDIFDILKKGLSFLSYFDLFLGPIEDDLGTNFESTT